MTLFDPAVPNDDDTNDRLAAQAASQSAASSAADQQSEPKTSPSWAPDASATSTFSPFYPLLAAILALSAFGPLASAATGIIRIGMSWVILAAILYLAHRLTAIGAAAGSGPRRFTWQPLLPLVIPVIAVYVISMIALQESGGAWWAPLVVAAVVAALTLVFGPVIARKRAVTP